MTRPIDPADVLPFQQGRMVLRQFLPYIDPHLARMIPVPIPGIGDRFACDRQYHVFYDPDRARRIPLAEFIADMAHEALAHLVPGHFERAEAGGLLNHNRVNIAGDKAGNQTVFALAGAFPAAIQPGGVVFPAVVTEDVVDKSTGAVVSSTVTPDGLRAIKASRWLHPVLDGQPLGLTMEDYYRLDKEAEEAAAAKAPPPPSAGGAGQPPPKPDDGDDGDDTDDDGDADGAGKGKSKPGKAKPGKGAGGDGDPADGDDADPEDGDADADGDGDDGSDPLDDVGEGGRGRGAPPPPDAKAGRGRCGSCSGGHGEDDLRETAEALYGPLPDGPDATTAAGLRVECARAILAYEKGAAGRGSIPSGLRRIAEGLLQPPKVDWRRRLRGAVRGAVARAAGSSDYTYTRRSRLAGCVGGGVVLPGLAAPQVRVAVVADTSGSMGASDLRRIGSEVRGLLASGLASHVAWIPTDAAAQTAQTIRHVRQAMDALVGGGGTDMGAGLVAAAAWKPRPSFTVVITDGDTGWPTTPPPACGRVLVVLTRPTSTPVPAWAVRVDAF